jgi:mannosyltransferase
VLLAGEVLKIPARMAAGRFVPRRAATIIGAYIAVNAVGLYTHYTFPFVLLAESLAFVVWLLGRPKKLHGLVTWALIQLAGLALFAPWLPTAFRQLTTWPRVPSEAVGPVGIAGAVAYGLTVPPDTARNALIPLGLLALVGLFPPFEAEDHPLRFGERIGFVALWLLVPIAIPVALGVVREPFLKFFVPAGLALQILAARGVVMGFRLGAPLPGTSALNAWLTRLVIAGLAIVGIALPVWTGLRNMYFDPAYARDDYRAIARRILEEAGPDAAVVLDAPSQVEVFGQYYPIGPNVTPLPDGQTEQSIARLLAGHDRVYALFWGENEQDPERTVENALNANAFAASSEWYGGVRLVTYVVPDAPAAEPDEHIDAGFGETITLTGYAVSDTTIRPGEALAVTLFWRADAPVEARYKVFVHLYYPDGTIAAQHDGEPGGGLRPTDGWTPGEVVADNHGLFLPADAPEGSYMLMVGLYDADNGERLPITRGEDAGDRRLALATVEVAR